MNKKNETSLWRGARSNLKWLAGAILLLVLAYATGSGFVVYSLYAVLLVMILSRIVTEICLKGLECTREISRAEATIGQSIEVILTVRNNGALPVPWVLVEDLVPEKMPITGERSRLLVLMPGKEEKMLYQLVVTRRGYHQIGPVLVETGDLFGFFRRYKTGAPKQYVTVYPTVEHIMEYDIAAKHPLGTVKVSNKIFEDPSRFIGTREYMPGDPFNRIHWKASARTGTLYSKICEPSRVIGATIVLDLHQNGYRGLDGKDRGELAIMTAASLAHYITGANEQVGLLTNGRDMAEAARWESAPLFGRIREQVAGRARKTEKSGRLAPFTIPTRKSVMQALNILRALARIDYTDGLTIDRILSHSIQHIGRDATILAIAPEVTDSLAVTLSIMKEAGYLINVFVVNDETRYFEAVEKLAPRSVDTYHVKDIGSIAKFATQDVYY